jgi:siroheme synthase
MMGLGRIERIAELLINRGWNAMTPAAVIFGAATARSDIWTMSLRDLLRQRLRPASIEKRRQDADDHAPATVVIGEVVRLGAVLSAQAEADEAAAGGQ